ncbi:MAG TPA: hypothetical protein PK522_00945 [Nitrosomonas sp.]|nr:hypothetical protein [Nitrosomonas sp.]
MITRDILDYNGDVIGSMDFPDGTSDEYISSVLSQYAVEPIVDNDSYLKFSIIERKKFADELLERFKLRNINEGINALQGMWMHHRLRAYPVSFGGMNFTIDIMNLAISGDLEIACLCLLYGDTDDGTETYHWLTSDRKAYLINELKSFLGWN